MSYYFKNLKPGLESESDDEDNLGAILSRGNNNKIDNESSDDELKTLSFNSLKKADEQMMEEEERELAKKPKSRKVVKPSKSVKQKEYKEESFDEEDSSDVDSEEDSEEDGGFFEEENANSNKRRSNKMGSKKKRSKHAPTEQSSKKRVSKIRKIPGLETPKTQNSNLYQDIRFDKSTGESTDLSVIRRRYQFLDEYREKEIQELEKMLHDRKFVQKITDEDPRG